MRRKDIYIASFIGLLIAALFFGIGQNLQVDVRLAVAGFLVFPAGSAFGMAVAQILGRKIPAFIQLARFLLVGALNTLVDLGVLNLLLLLTGVTSGILFSAFKGISFLAAVLNSYGWNKWWTFQKGNEQRPAELLQFFLVSVGGFALNVGAASFLVNSLGPQFGLGPALWANGAALMATLVSMVWNFLGYKLLVFER